MIRHTVVFRLKHPDGSPEERGFLEDSLVLADIPTVRNFERLRQVSPKNQFSFGFSMEFDSREAFEEYVTHPIHEDFVRERWMTEVSDFLEIDYSPL